MNSTPGIRASTIRLTALTPPPPTPTTRMTGWCGSPLPGGSYSGSSRPYLGASTIGSTSRRCGLGSSEKTLFSRSGGVSCDSSTGGVEDGTSPAACEDDVSSSATGPVGDSSSPSSAVDRNRSERGPSRMLARLLRRLIVRQNLLRQLAVVVRGATAGIVLE